MTTVADVLGQADVSANLPIYLDFDGYTIKFVSNSQTLNAELKDYYKHFLGAETDAIDCLVEGVQSAAPDIEGDWQVKQPDPGKTKIKEHILKTDDGKVVRKVLTGVHLFFLGSRRVCTGPLEDNPNQVVNFINNMFLDYLLAPAGQLFHAAGVCRGDFGIGMAGQSGKGKSTLALRLLQRGLDLVSNDRLVVFPEAGNALHMHGIPKYPRINPGTVINQPELRNIATAENIARYEAMPIDELWDLEEKYDAFVEDAFGVKFKLGATMNMFVALDWDRNSDASTVLEKRDPVDCPALVETIMKTPGVMLPASSDRIPSAVVEPYIELLGHCDFYALTGGVDFDSGADQVMALL